MEMQESRSDGAIKVFRGISNTTQMMTVALPLAVVVAGLIDNNSAALKKGLYLAESAAATTFITAGAVIGAGSAWLMYKANKWLFKKKTSSFSELQPVF